LAINTGITAYLRGDIIYSQAVSQSPGWDWPIDNRIHHYSASMCPSLATIVSTMSMIIAALSL